MDFLSSAIEAEIKKSKASLPSSDGPRKYIKRGDLERAREEQYLKEQEQRERERQEKLKRKANVAEDEKDAKKAKSRAVLDDVKDQLEEEGARPETFNVSNEEVIRRFRAKGQPIRLFDESDKDRRLRLRALELMEEKFDGQRNEFQKALEDLDAGLELEALTKRVAQVDQDVEKVRQRIASVVQSGSASPASPMPENYASPASEAKETTIPEEPIEPNLIRADIDKLYLLIYSYLKRLLTEWQEALSERPEAIRRSAQGKRDAVVQKQSVEYLQPLFSKLKSKSLEPDVLARISEITHHMQRREYLKAQEYYLQLAIGNAPWPIGVTAVGIHERSSRERIHSSQVAHVLNDEKSRKYIQSLKRLMTFCQEKYPPSSRAMMA